MKQDTRSMAVLFGGVRRLIAGLVGFVTLLLPFKQVASMDFDLLGVLHGDAQATSEQSVDVQLAAV